MRGILPIFPECEHEHKNATGNSKEDIKNRNESSGFHDGVQNGLTIDIGYPKLFMNCQRAIKKPAQRNCDGLPALCAVIWFCDLMVFLKQNDWCLDLAGPL